MYAGHQLVQTAHSVAEFAHKFPNQFKDWFEKSQYMVSLSTDNEDKLKRLYLKLRDNGANVVGFTEPDIGDQLTAICYYGTPEMRKYTDKLDLALKNQKS